MNFKYIHPLLSSAFPQFSPFITEIPLLNKTSSPLLLSHHLSMCDALSSE